MQHFYVFFFWNADSVRVVSSSSGSGQAELYRIHYLSHIFTVLCEVLCGMANVLLVQLGDLGERCKLPQWVWHGRSPALNDICCILG